MTFKNLANKFPNVFQKEEEQSEKSASFMILSQFSFHMVHLGIPIDLANAIILACAQKVNLDADRTCVLLAELQANQRTNLNSEEP